MESLLHVRTFGPLAIDVPNRNAPISRHAAGLLAYLATILDKPVTRDRIAALLWDKGDAKKARHSLSQLIYSLKSHLPHGCLAVDSRCVRLTSGCVTSDYHTFTTAIQQGKHAAALVVYNGSFLENLAFITEEYDDWRIACSAAAEADAVSACVALITDALECEDHHAAGDMAKLGLSISPTNEYFARIRIEALASSGDVNAALRELEAAKSRLLITTGSIPDSLTGPLASRIARLPVIEDQRVTAGISTRLVGRQREIRDLRTHWELAKTSFRLAVIGGEPGIGKSRLMQHTVRWAVLEGARSFMYSSSEVESKLPGSTIVGLLRDGFRKNDVELLEARWQNALGSLAPEVLSTGRPTEESPRVMWEAVARYFSIASAKTPVVIAIDDFQWIDDESREMLAYLRKRLPEYAIFLIVAGRGHVKPPGYEDDEGQTPTFYLNELSPADTYLLFDEFETTHGIHIDESARRLLVGGIGGRPFFLMEALRHLREVGGDGSAATMVADLMSPSIEAYLGRRFTGLGTKAHAVCAVATILNREVPLHVVSRVTGMSVMDVAEGASELVKHGILAEAHTIRFAHSLMREVGLATLPRSQRRVWHLKIAAALENLDGTRISEIAFHLEEGGDRDGAFTCADRAASETLRAGAYADAEQQYCRMLRCAHGERVLYAQAAYLKFLARFNRFSDVQQFLLSLETYFQQNEDHEGMVVCAIARYWIAEKDGDLVWEESIARAKDIVRMAELYTPQKITAVLWQVADAMRRSGEFALLGNFARILHERSAASDSDPGMAAEMLAIAALLAGSADGHKQASGLADQAVKVAELLEDQTVLTRALYSRGTARFWSGDLHGARSDYDQVLSSVDTFVPDDLVVRVKSNYAVVLMEQGEYQLAEEFAQATLREAGMVRRSYAFGNLALIHLRQGDYTASRKYIMALLAANETAPQGWIRMHAEALLGLIDLAVGDIDAAKARGSIISSHEQSTDGVIDSSHIYSLRAKLAVLEGNVSDAVRSLAEGIAAIEHKEVIAAARLEIELAAALLASGQAAQARSICSRVALRGREGAAWALVSAAEELLGQMEA
jgi:DNA-binding SARP family transcriptional activator/tetratricopeptide (TPR) repeat protein